MTITLDKETTFDLPEGSFHAHITGLKSFNKPSAKGKQNWLRLLFEVSVPSLPDLDCRAGRNFQLNFRPGSDLRNFLTPMLGPDFFKENSAKDICLEELLVGKTGSVTLSHYIGEGYEKPLVVVEAFELAGKD